MKSNKKVVKKALVGLLVLAMGVTTVFANAGNSYAAGEAKLNKTSRSILTRQSFDFDVTGAPSDASVTWKSSNEKVATVDKDGVVTGVTKGTATITCEITSGGKTQKLTAKVSICKPAVKIEINNKVSELKYGTKVDLNRTLTPKTSNDVTTWKSSDTKIATVDSNGVVTALKDGTVTITATTMSGRSDSVEITVYGAPAPTKAPEATATPVPTAKPDAPKPTTKPTPVPQSTVEKYDISKLQTAGGYQYTQSGTKITIEQQYGEAKYALPTSLAVKDYKTMKISLGSASDQLAYKLYDAEGTMLAVWYGQNATAEFMLTESMGQDGTGASIDQNAKIAVIGIMANNGACSADILGIEFVAKANTAKPSPTPSYMYDIAKLQEAGGYQYTQSGNKLSFEQQYAEAKYSLSTPLTVKAFKTMTISVGFASDQLAYKLYDAEGTMLAVWYGQNATAEFKLTESMGQDGTGAPIDQNAKIAVVGIMANNGACEATITGISFK